MGSTACETWLQTQSTPTPAHRAHLMPVRSSDGPDSLMGNHSCLSQCITLFQIQAGLPDPSLAAFPRLTYVLKGIHRTTPEHRRKHRLPITLHILRAIQGVWSTPPISYNHVMLWAACCTGFFGFLRAGEFTCPAANIADPPLTPSDISIDSRENPQVITIHLRRTKTDPFGVGCNVYLCRTRMTPCPVAAMLHYLAARPSAHGPLFTFEDGAPLTRAALETHLQTALSHAGIEHSNYTGHSFRIGAATAAAQAGYSDSFSQSLGRWKSSAFVAYIRASTNDLAAIAPRLAQAVH